MTGGSKFSIDDLEDDEEETPDLVLVSDSLNDKFKDFSDIKIEDEIQKFEALVHNQTLLLKDGGGKFQQYLHSLQREKQAREKKKELVVRLWPISRKSHFTSRTQFCSICTQICRKGGHLALQLGLEAGIFFGELYWLTLYESIVGA